MDENEEEKTLLPHHQQMPLCTTRLPYRQGRKLTAVKVYTISDESNHLLVFGVPSLNLRQETKALFCKFGKLIHFTITDKHVSEMFTETYHAVYERIQSARAAKRMLDTKNFYGGLLHVCYAPELESLEETRQKLTQRTREVFVRLKKNHEEIIDSSKLAPQPDVKVEKSKLMNMGDNNIIVTMPNARKRKIFEKGALCKKTKVDKVPAFNMNPAVDNSDYDKCSSSDNDRTRKNDNIEGPTLGNTEGNVEQNGRLCAEVSECSKIDLNYSEFGKEIVRKVPEKPLNRIKFYINKKYNGYFIVT